MGIATESKLTRAYLERDCKQTRLVRVIELVVDQCANTNGDSPCEATELCYDTPVTCMDYCNYACGHTSIWLSSCEGVPDGFPHDAIPNLIEWDENPPVIDLGNVFGTRASAEFKFADHAHNDHGIDRYQDRRYPVIPICHTDVPGTFWGRFRARHKTLRQRLMRFYQGPRDGVFPDDYECHEYVISEYGRDDEGNFCISGLDILFLAGNDSATCPGDQTGEQKFFAGSATNGRDVPRLTSTIEDDFSPGDLFAEDEVFRTISQMFSIEETMPGGLLHNVDVVCIGRELFQAQVTPVAVNDDRVVIKMLSRGFCDTEQRKHEPGTPIVIPFVITKGEHVVDLIERLLLECASIDDVIAGCCEEVTQTRICRESFDEIKRCNPDMMIGRTLYLCDMEGVTDLLNEITTDYMLNMMVDQRSGEIVLKSLSNPPPCGDDLAVLRECSIVGTVEWTTDVDDQAGIVSVAYDPPGKLDEVTADNASQTLVYINRDAARPRCERVEYTNTRTLNRFSRWYDVCIDYLVEVYLRRLAQWMRCEPQVIRVRYLVRDMPRGFWTGDYFRIEHSSEQNADGGFSEQVYLARSVKLNPDGDCYLITARSAPFLTRYNYVSNFICDEPECSVLMQSTIQQPSCGRFPTDCTNLWW